MASDSDEEDTFVTIGTPLEPYEEDEVAARKPVHLEDQTVKDSRGRQRFHGAFTGGFSAGYFNTVGSKDGWAPSTFVSSRSGRAEKATFNPEDFMDDEDLGEHGIAPRTITATDSFRPTEVDRQKRKLPVEGTGIIPGDSVLEDLVVPARVPMGMRLLRKLGWRDGQGIGPRAKRKMKRKVKVQSESAKKVYGCAFPPPEDQSSEESDVGLENVTFAPKDVTPITFDPKDNMHGIGYRGLSATSVLGQVNRFDPEPVGGSTQFRGKKGIRGKAFGVGALEDDDDDVYAMDSMSNYDRELVEERPTSHGWTRPKHGQGASAVPAIGYLSSVLEGFKLSSQKANSKKTYPAPVLPRGFRPVHVFKKPDDVSSQQIQAEQGATRKKNIDTYKRAEILGEKPDIKSVFELVSSKDKEKMESAKSQLPIKPPSSSVSSQQPIIDAQLMPTPISQPQPSPLAPPSELAPPPVLPPPALPPTSRATPLFTGSLSGFKPFAKDPPKQQRYEEYLQLKKHNQSVNSVLPPGMMEFERQRELEEFSRAAVLYKPMANMMASRFTRAKYDDDDKTVLPNEGGDQSDQAKAVSMKMFGRLTRDKFEWHPDRTLCKRFNIANPYPDSTIVGVPKVRRDKYSVFTFLDFPDGPVPEPEPPKPPEPEKKTEESLNTKPKLKPLAILASMDLAPGPSKTSQSESDSTATTSRLSAETGEGSQEGQSTTGGITKGSTEEKRPPMDLFKAIFASSESSSSSSSEDEKEEKESEAIGLKPSPASEDTPKVKDIDKEGPTKGPRSPSESPSESPSGRLSTRPIAAPSIPSEPVESRLSPVNGEEARAYGPALPPPASTALPPSASTALPPPASTALPPPASTAEAGSSESSKDKDKTSKKHKSKHKKKKSKHKKKKSKHKSKHQKKSKKSSRKEVIVVTSSSGSEADSESGSNDSEPIPSNSDIINRLKNLAPGSRVSAAEFW